MQQTIVVLSCDLCGSEKDVMTVPVGTLHEADLCETDRDQMDAALSPFLAVARRRGNRAVAPAKRAAPRTTGLKPKATYAEIREWARAQGYRTSDRGRLPNALVKKFNAAQA